MHDEHEEEDEDDDKCQNLAAKDTSVVHICLWLQLITGHARMKEKMDWQNNGLYVMTFRASVQAYHPG